MSARQSIARLLVVLLALFQLWLLSVSSLLQDPYNYSVREQQGPLQLRQGKTNSTAPQDADFYVYSKQNSTKPTKHDEPFSKRRRVQVHNNLFDQRQHDNQQAWLNLTDSREFQETFLRLLTPDALNGWIQNHNIIDQLPPFLLDYTFGLVDTGHLFLGLHIEGLQISNLQLVNVVQAQTNGPHSIHISEITMDHLELGDEITIEVDIVTHLDYLFGLVDRVQNSLATTIPQVVQEFFDEASDVLGGYRYQEARDAFVENITDSSVTNSLERNVDLAVNNLQNIRGICSSFVCLQQQASDGIIVELKGKKTFTFPRIDYASVQDLVFNLFVNQSSFQSMQIGRFLQGDLVGCSLSLLDLAPELVTFPWLNFSSDNTSAIDGFRDKILQLGIDWLDGNANADTGIDFVDSGIQQVSDALGILDQIATEAVKEQAADLYALITARSHNQAIPSFFNYLSSLWTPAATTCPDMKKFTGTIDFRDLFLSPTQAQAMGGTGAGQYGPHAVALKENLDDFLLPVKLNSFLLEQMDGTFTVHRDFFSVDTPNGIPELGIDSVDIRIFDLIVQNFNTFGDPSYFFEPSSTDGSLLNSAAAFSNRTHPLRVSFNVSFAMEGDPAYDMRNELEVSLEAADANLFLVVFAKLEEEGFLSLEFQNILDFNCWLAAFTTPELNDEGLLVPGSASSLMIRYFNMNIPSFGFNAFCNSCTSPGLNALPAILETLTYADTAGVLGNRLKNFVLALLNIETAQIALDRWLADAPKKCPASVDFVEGYKSNYTELRIGLSDLTYDSVETIAFASIFLFELAIVVVGMSPFDDVKDTDPLTGQKQLAVPDEVRFLDFTTLGGKFGEFANSAISFGLDFFNRRIPVDSEDPSLGEELQINKLLREHLFDKSGYVSYEFGVEDVEIRFVGLDSFTAFDMFQAIGPQTFKSDLSWRRLGVEIIVHLAFPDDEGEGDFKLTVELEDFSVSMAMLLAVDLGTFESIELGSILHLENILPCILSTVHEADVTQLRASVGSLRSFSVTGFQSSEISLALEDISRKIQDTYADAVLSSLPGFFDTVVRAMAKDAIDFYLDQDSNAACSKITFDSTDPNFIDFRDLLLSKFDSIVYGGTGNSQYGDLFRSAFDTLRNSFFQVDLENGLSTANDELVGPTTRSISNITGALTFSGPFFNRTASVGVGGLNSQIRFLARDARIDNIDTVGPNLRLLEAVRKNGHELNNSAVIGIAERPLKFAVNFLVSIFDRDGVQLRNDMTVTLGLESAQLVLGVLLNVIESRLMDFPLRDLLNYNCWLATMPAPELDTRGGCVGGVDRSGLTAFDASVKQITLDVTCLECSSPLMNELSDLLSAPQAVDDVTEAANGLLRYVSQLLRGEFLQVEVDRILNVAVKQCPHSPDYVASSTYSSYFPFENDNSDDYASFLILFFIVAGCLFFSVAFLGIVLKWIVRRRHQEWLRALPSRQVFRLLTSQGLEQKFQSDLNSESESMFRSQHVPAIVRWFMPFVLVGTIGLCLAGHLSVAAEVILLGNFAGQEFMAEDLNQFSMAQSTVELWQAGGKELAILILLVSGVWPYAKQLTTLALWFLPPTWVSISRRGTILSWLDFLAKWSMVDVFVIIIMIVSFRITINSPDVQFLPEEFYSVELMVVPCSGLYANLTAQLVSQIASNYIIRYHRRIVKKTAILHETKKQPLPMAEPEALPADEPLPTDITEKETKAEEDKDEEGDKLSKHAYQRPHRSNFEKLVVRPGTRPVVLFVVITVVFLVTLGCILPSVVFEVQGIVGLVVELGRTLGEEAVTEHSVISMAQLLMDQGRILNTNYDGVAHLFLAALFVLTVLIIPVFQSLGLLRQWFVPSTQKERSKLSSTIEILAAWQYAEVYLMSLFVASWQLGPISEFLNAEYCQGYQAILSRLAHFGVLEDEDAVCFNTSSTILDGSYLLAAGAILLALLNTFVTKAVYQYFRDKQDESAHAPTDTPVSTEDKGGVDKENGDTDRGKDEVDPGILESIQPVPVLFTDTFFFCVRPEKIIEVDSYNPETPQSGLFSDYAPSQRTVMIPKEEPSSPIDNVVAGANPEKDPDLSQRIFTMSTDIPVHIDVSNMSSTSSIVSNLDDESRLVKPKGGDLLVNMDTPDKSVASVERKVRSYLENGLDEWTSDDDSDEKKKEKQNLDAWTSSEDDSCTSRPSDDDSLPPREKEDDARGDNPNSQSNDNLEDWTGAVMRTESIDEDDLFA